MPKVKFFAVERNYEGRRDEELYDRLLPDISDWTEITQAQLNNLRIHRDSIEDALRTNKTLGYGERLLFVIDLPAKVVESAVIKIDQIIDSVAKKQNAAEEKRAATEKKRKENAEKNRVEKELKQLEKLKQKYGGEA